MIYAALALIMLIVAMHPPIGLGLLVIYFLALPSVLRWIRRWR